MKKTNKKGFTIVELVIVIAVIGILAAILIPTFVNLTKNAQDAALQSNLRNAYTAYIADAELDEENDQYHGKLVVKGMEEVVIADAANLSGTEYVWNGSEEKWVEYSGTAPTVKVGSAYVHPTDSNKNTTADQNSEYNSFFIFVKPAA